MSLPPGFFARPATADDPDLVAGIRTERHPDQPWVGEDIAFQWREDAYEHDAVRTLVERTDGFAVAYVAAVHRRWHLNPKGQERWARLKIDVRPGADEPGLLAGLLEMAEGELDDADVLATSVREHDERMLGFYEAAGYSRERLGRWSVLDLVEQGAVLAEMKTASDRSMAEQGVTVVTLDRLLAEHGEAFMRRLMEVSNEAEADVPTTEPYYPTPYEGFVEWLRRPGLFHDRVFVGMGPDGSIMGLSMLHYPKAGPPWTDWTFTSRGARGRGIARALKLATALQAWELGATVIRTENDGENRPILHLNDEFGYRVVPGELELVKRRRRR